MKSQLPFNEGEESILPEHLTAPGEAGGRGCFFWGCLIMVLLFVLIVVGTGGCVFIAYIQVDSLFEEEGVVFKEISESETRLDGIRERIALFRQAPSDGGDDKPLLVLGADELNILVRGHQEPVVADLARFLRLGITDSTLEAEVSFPMDWGATYLDKAIEHQQARDRPVPWDLEFMRSLVGFFEGRFFNAVVELGLEVRQEKVMAKILKVKLSGSREFGAAELRRGDQEKKLEEFEEKMGRTFEDIFFGDAPGRKRLGIRDGKLFLRRLP
ncbi:MAG: hypothetical protein VX272_05230 [Planctomycetota bacterium]|nr:hypothetical protein [Planctomycetota bacterium]